MEFVHRFTKTDLARNTRRVIRAVQRGQTAVIESHGEPEAAIIDIIDFHVLRAAMRYHNHRPQIDSATGLSDDKVTAASDAQERYDLVLGHYLAEAISLGRAAELLGLTWLDLRTRFVRMDVPLRLGPSDADEARAEAEVALRLGGPG